VPAKQLAERAGRSRAGMTLDTDSHVLTDPTELTAADVLSRCGPGLASGA
jgi:hypothetical protein